MYKAIFVNKMSFSLIMHNINMQFIMQNAFIIQFSEIINMNIKKLKYALKITVLKAHKLTVEGKSIS